MIDLNPIMSILTSNINGQNTPGKKQIQSYWKKGDPTIYAQKKIHFKYKV